MEEERDAMFWCWVNTEEKILSFHYEEGYELRTFLIKAEYQEYLHYLLRCNYKVQ